MIAVRGKCPRCGATFVVPAKAVSVWRRPDECDELHYECPVCSAQAAVCASSDDVNVLADLSVPFFAVPVEALQEHSGPTFTVDDLIDFHFLLESDKWMRGIEARM